MYQTVQMPDNKVWFAQNLNYTKGLYYNTASNMANGVSFTSDANGVPAIGSYWCPPKSGSVLSGSEADCNIYGALYTWETIMMVDGRYADDTKTSITWDETWVSGNYYTTGAPGTTDKANINNARGGGRGICPPGWHVPTDREWAQLLDAVEGNSTYTSQSTAGWWGANASVKMKSQFVYTGTDPGDGSWQDDANRGTNTTGFGAVPAGARANNGAYFTARGTTCHYRSSSVVSSSNAWRREFNSTSNQVRRLDGFRANGMPVRCVRG
jgi:uncharacterized protein (TIGR02145 family)